MSTMADIETLAARIYAQGDLMPSALRNRGFSFKYEDAKELARCILASDWLATDRAVQRAEGAETALREAERDLPAAVRDTASPMFALGATAMSVRTWLCERADRIGGAS